MPGWFDTYAKRTARAASKPPLGVSRRRVIAGGSAAVGLAWAAPLLTSAPAYAYGVSGCASNQICGNPGPNELQYCCPGVVSGTSPVPTHDCRVEGGLNTCYPKTGNGAFCGNQGNGQCNNTTKANCNSNNAGCNCGPGYAAPTYFPHTCGGYGATCKADVECASGYICTNLNTTGPNQGGVCAQSCSSSSSCPTNFTCAASASPATASGNTCRRNCTSGAPECPKNGNSTCVSGVCS